MSDENLINFCAVTGADEARGKFYLDAANGDLNIAIEQYFENPDGSGDVEEIPTTTTTTARQTNNRLLNDDDDDDDDNDEDFNPEREEAIRKQKQRHTPQRAAAKKASSSTNRIFTMDQMRGDDHDHDNNDDADDDDEDDDKKDGQAFYAGGSSTSGQQILGPKKRNPEKIIKDLFSKAKEHGAEEVEAEADHHHSRPVVYGGGYRLGTGSEPTELIPGPSKPKVPKKCILKLWKNGFNIDDDATLRTYTDPANKEFLSSIQKGELPRELTQRAEGGEVHLDMQDHRDEDFVPPKNNKPVLYNDGYKLGDGASSASVNIPTAASGDKQKNEDDAKKALLLDTNQPTTQIQIRLADGSRLIVKANQTHTIADIRKYIITSRPEYNGLSYSLMTSFPNKELTNDNETLKGGSLLNAVIIQKMK